MKAIGIREFGAALKLELREVERPGPGEPLELAETGSVFFTRPHLADYIADANEIGMRAGDLFRAAESGELVVTIDREYPLEDARLAHEAMEGRKSRGKILLSVA